MWCRCTYYSVRERRIESGIWIKHILIIHIKNPLLGVMYASLFIGTMPQTFAVLFFLLQLMCLKVASNITHLTHHQLICYAYGTPPTLHRGIAPLVLRDVCNSSWNLLWYEIPYLGKSLWCEVGFLFSIILFCLLIPFLREIEAVCLAEHFVDNLKIFFREIHLICFVHIHSIAKKNPLCRGCVPV